VHRGTSDQQRNETSKSAQCNANGIEETNQGHQSANQQRAESQS